MTDDLPVDIYYNISADTNIICRKINTFPVKQLALALPEEPVSEPPTLALSHPYHVLSSMSNLKWVPDKKVSFVTVYLLIIFFKNAIKEKNHT